MVCKCYSNKVVKKKTKNLDLEPGPGLPYTSSVTFSTFLNLSDDDVLLYEVGKIIPVQPVSLGLLWVT